MTLKEVKNTAEEIAQEETLVGGRDNSPKAEAPAQKTLAELRKEISERLLAQLRVELQNVQTIISNQLVHSQNLMLLIELVENEVVVMNKPVLQ